MANAHSTTPPAPSKPNKPRPDFPLFPHATGRWAKKIRGKLVYFGKWADPEAAESLYRQQKDALERGEVPANVLTVRSLCGRFLTRQESKVLTRDLAEQSFLTYAGTCRLLLKVLGKNRPVANLRPADFAKLRAVFSERWGPVRVGSEITRVKTIFHFAAKEGLIERAMIYGSAFDKPSRKVIRRHKRERGPKFFEADEIRRMLAAAEQPLKAMILLGVNCGFGNADVGALPISAIDDGWIVFPRPKTEIERRAPLWPETAAALRDWLAIRTATRDDLVFTTRCGNSWSRSGNDSPISKEFRKLLDRLDIKGHRSFYALRHVFQTVGDESRDFIAVRKIMGHVGANIADEYRERVSDDRLRAVANHVHAWLFGAEGGVK